MTKIVKNTAFGFILISGFALLLMGISAFALTDYLKKLDATLARAELRLAETEAELNRRGKAPRQFPVSRCLTEAIGNVPVANRNSAAFMQMETLCALTIYPDAAEELRADAKMVDTLVKTNPKILQLISELQKGK